MGYSQSHDRVELCLILEDMKLLSGHFWMIQAMFNEINLKVVTWMYFG